VGGGWRNLDSHSVTPRWGPRGLPSTRIFMFLGGMNAAFVPSHSLETWRAQRLDSADVDSRVLVDLNLDL